MKDTERGRTRERLGTQYPSTGGPGPAHAELSLPHRPQCLPPPPKDEVGLDEVCRSRWGGIVGTMAVWGLCRGLTRECRKPWRQAPHTEGRGQVTTGRTLNAGTLLHSVPDKGQEDP